MNRRFILQATLVLLSLIRAVPLLAESYPVFIEQNISKNSLYVGEQALYSFTLNTQTSIFNFQQPELTLPHAWSENVAVSQRYRRTIEGEPWTAYSTRRAIYPLSPGELSIPALSIPVGIQVKVRSKVPAPFDFGDAFSQEFLEQFFAEVEPKTVELNSPGAIVTVKSLPPPPADLPPAAGGYIPVGATSLSARPSRLQTNVGESITLEVNLVSVGNLNPINELDFKAPSGIRIYPEQAKKTQNENNSALIMRKTFRYGLVPIAPGRFRLNSIKVPYFDTASGVYRVLETAAYELEVFGAALPVEPTVAAANPETQAPTPESTATPATVPAPEPEADAGPSIIGDRVSPETALLAASSVLLLMLLAAIIFILRRSRRPYRLFKNAVKNAHSVSELSDTFRAFLITRLAPRDALYTYEEMTVFIKRAKLSRHLEFLTLSLLDTFEQTRFAPGNEVSKDLDRLKFETLSVASGILSAKVRAATPG